MRRQVRPSDALDDPAVVHDVQALDGVVDGVQEPLEKLRVVEHRDSQDWDHQAVTQVPWKSGCLALMSAACGHAVISTRPESPSWSGGRIGMPTPGIQRPYRRGLPSITART